MKTPQELQTELADLDLIAKTMELEANSPERVAEIRNIRAGYFDLLTSELMPPPDEVDEIRNEAWERLMKLSKDPDSMGKHGKII